MNCPSVSVKLTPSCCHAMSPSDHKELTILLSSTLLDTDVYAQAAAISHEIPGILCIRKKNELLSCKSMCSDQNVAKCLIPFLVMTGCDSNSCFYGHGKLSLFERMAKSAEARSLLLKCGESLQLSDDALNDL